jgi:hypothetical protein
MYRYLFTKLIFDEFGHSMRGLLEYKKPIYVCSEYSKNSKNCFRIKIEEETINEFVLKNCGLKNKMYEKKKEYMRKIISKIVVFKNGEFEISFTDGSFACFKENCIRYV